MRSPLLPACPTERSDVPSRFPEAFTRMLASWRSRLDAPQTGQWPPSLKLSWPNVTEMLAAPHTGQLTPLMVPPAWLGSGQPPVFSSVLQEHGCGCGGHVANSDSTAEGKIERSEAWTKMALITSQRGGPFSARAIRRIIIDRRLILKAMTESLNEQVVLHAALHYITDFLLTPTPTSTLPHGHSPVVLP